MTDLLDDLRTQIRRRRLVVVTGAGVSVSMSGGSPEGSWSGLLESGIQRVGDLQSRQLPKGWADIVRTQATSGDLEFMLAAAEEITFRLGGPAGAEFRRWLRESVGSLPLADPRIGEALATLALPITTTNYDGLMETVTGWLPLTWLEGASLLPVLRQEEHGVVHLHGYWRAPESIVFGIRSYEAVLRNAAAQALQQSMTTMSGLVLVGFGAGLKDPNFGALRRWMAATFPSAEHRHFRLCRTSEIPAVEKEHRPEERIVPIGYGAGFESLPDFLAELASTQTPTTRATLAPETQVQTGRLPAARPIVGRHELSTRLVRAMLETPPARPIMIAGAPGIGKTTLSVAVAHSADVAKKFSDQRWFVRAESAMSARELIAEIAALLGLTQLSDSHNTALTDRVLARLSRGPALLILDNLETPWTADPLAVEDLVRQLVEVPELLVVVTIRGLMRPAGINWNEPVVVPPLDLASAHTIFLTVAGPHFTDDPALDTLLGGLAGMPLAIELMAHAAQGQPDLEELAARWQVERSAMLTRAGGNRRELSVAASIELSINNPLLTESGKRLLALLGQLPDGIHRTDLEKLLPGTGRRGAGVLRQLGLAYDETARLRTLAPIREHVAASHPPTEEDIDAAVAHYCRLVSSLNQQLGGEKGANAVTRLSTETGNLARMLRRAVQNGELGLAIPALVAFVNYLRLAGAPEPGILDLALGAAQQVGDRAGEAALLQSQADLAIAQSKLDIGANLYARAKALYDQLDNLRGIADCKAGLGEVAFARSNHPLARKLFEDAEDCYQQMEDIPGRANCIHRIGDVALRTRDLDAAQDLHELARALFRQVGNLRGEAQCTLGLGDIALLQGRLDDALANFLRTKELYEHAGDLRGQARSVVGMGDLELARGDPDAAYKYYERSRALFRRFGDLQTEARSTRRMADAELQRRNYGSAEELYRQAQETFERIGDISGQADSHKGMGDVSAARSEDESAFTHWSKAVGLYQQVPDPYELGLVYRRLARIAQDQATRVSRLTAAKNLWKSINRDDLVADVDQELRSLP